MAGATVTLFCLYTVAHAVIAIFEIFRQACRPSGTTSIQGFFVRAAIVFFTLALVANNSSLAAGGLKSPGRANKAVFYLGDFNHLVLLPIIIPMAGEIALRVRAEAEGSAALPPPRWLRPATWLAAVIFGAMGIYQLYEEMQQDEFPTVKHDSGVAYYAPPRESLPIGVIAVSLSVLTAGAYSAWRIQYWKLLALQGIGLVGQVVAASSKGYVQVVSNGFEVVFMLSLALAERRFFSSNDFVVSILQNSLGMATLLVEEDSGHA
eukprot:jgi/Bigna1/81944/fgenesh1_pg.86_\